jgi:hypothetical protein
MRKRPLEDDAAASARAADAIDITAYATVAYSSEDPAQPVEHLLEAVYAPDAAGTHPARRGNTDAGRTVSSHIGSSTLCPAPDPRRNGMVPRVPPRKVTYSSRFRRASPATSSSSPPSMSAAASAALEAARSGIRLSPRRAGFPV